MSVVPTPDLDPGLTLLRTPTSRSIALHQLVLDAATAPGTTLWVDAGSNATTTTLYELASHRRVLADFKIARAFTAYQHHTLIRDLLDRVTARTNLVVTPCVASLYRDEDLAPDEADALCTASVALLADLARAATIPVLCTDAADDAFSDVLDAHAETTIAADHTAAGHAYAVDGAAPQAYWAADGRHWQTTIPYWVELFGETTDTMAVSAVDVGIVEVV